MTWSYGGDPTGEPKDEVRFLVGDTDEAEKLAQDEEIEFALTLYPQTEGKPAFLAAAYTASAIAAQFARRADRSIGSLSISAKQQRDHYVELADSLRFQALTNGLGTTITEGDRPGFGSVPMAGPLLGQQRDTQFDRYMESDY